MCHKAGLNIGISVGIWSIFPFMVSLLELCLFGSLLKKSSFIGMMGMVLMAVLISFSDVLLTPEVSLEEGQSTPAD